MSFQFVSKDSFRPDFCAESCAASVWLCTSSLKFARICKQSAGCPAIYDAQRQVLRLVVNISSKKKLAREVSPSSLSRSAEDNAEQHAR
eukprot:6210939-Pleurochrysis_carterae.AAC.3